MSDSSCSNGINSLISAVCELQKKVNNLTQEVDNLRNNTTYAIEGTNKQNSEQEKSIQDLFALSSSGQQATPITQNRTITHYNQSGQIIDLYLTLGNNGSTIQKIATITNGNNYIFNIPNNVYNWQGNFNVLPTGDKCPNNNAGPTLAEFGLNQIWAGSKPPLRDTFDISTVPAGIGNLLCNNGQDCRNQAVEISQATGLYTLQQSYNYNFGCKIVPPNGTLIPPPGNLQTVSCTNTLGYPSDAIGYPLDTACPKQQTGSAMPNIAGNYVVCWTGPVVSLGNYKLTNPYC